MPALRPALVLVTLLAGLALPAAAAEGEDLPLRPGPAYWLAGADGAVFAFGRAVFAGSASGTPLRRAVAAIAATPDGEGYWLVGRDGGVFAFGQAPFLGGVADLPLNGAVVDIATTPTGQGYWLAGADGGVFAFGDAPWLGGLSGADLNAPVTAIVATPSGRGYWLVGRDGGVFAFGDAPWLGGLAGTELRDPVVDMASTPSGTGYWLVGADGGVFAFGDAGFHGSALGQVRNAPVVGVATTHTGEGYWLAAGDGGVFAFGDAGFYGSAGDDHLNRPVVGIVAGLGRAVPEQEQRLRSTFGWDVSWPQCGRPLPPPPYGFAVVGVTNGHAFSVNPCLASQHRWSLRHGSLGGLYLNVNYPSKVAEALLPAVMLGACGLDDLDCQLYQWGARGAAEAVEVAQQQDVASPLWWLDVETTNRWSPDPRRNELIIRGAIDSLHARRLQVGIYSTGYQWSVIAGAFSPGLPTWVAGPRNVEEAAAACSQAASFGGGTPWMVQYPLRGFDANLMCPAGEAQALASFRLPPLPPVPQVGDGTAR